MGKMVVLVMSILMPPNVPDINHAQKMDSMETCWSAAKDYMTHDLTDTMRSKGALGLSAGCAFQEMPSQRN